MPSNLGTLIAGPALVQFKGRTFFAKGDIALSADIETFNVEVDAFGGTVEERESNAPLNVSFTPAGKWDDLAVLWPYQNPSIGASIQPVISISAVDVDTETLTVDSTARLRDGVPLDPATFGTLPTGLVAGTVVYGKIVDATHLTLHTTEAYAIAGTNKVNLTAAGTGDSVLVEQEPLVIHTLAGQKLTFFSAAVTAMPDFLGSAVASPIGAVTFEIFRKNAVAASTAASRYSVAAASLDLAAQGFDPTDIVTQPYAANWGASAPWLAFNSKNGFRATFPVTLTPIEDDASGIIGRRLSSVRAEVRAQPTNANEAAMLAALLIQDTGAGRGRRLSGSDLNLTGTGVYVRIYGAALKSAPQTFSSQQDRAGEHVWTASRTFTAGAPGPVFYIGTAAPA